LSGSWFDKVLDFFGISEQEELDAAQDVFEEELPGRKRAPVVSIHTSPEVKIMVVYPDSFDDAEKLSGYLKSRKPVVVNFTGVSREVAQRILDFLSGTVYALNGSMQKISQEAFLFAPNNITVATDNFGSDLKEQFLMRLEQGGVKDL